MNIGAASEPVGDVSEILVGRVDKDPYQVFEPEHGPDGLAIALVEPARSAFVGSPVHQTMMFAGGAATPLLLANLGATMMYTDTDDGDEPRVDEVCAHVCSSIPV